MALTNERRLSKLPAAVSLIVAAIAPFFAIDCGETEKDATGSSAGGSAGIGTGGGGQPSLDASTDGDAYADHWELDVGDVTPGYDGPAYDGDQSCAPEPTGFGAYVSCCEGVPCEGECHLLGGSWQCDCNGITGGCGQYSMHCCQGGCQAYCPGGPGK